MGCLIQIRMPVYMASESPNNEEAESFSVSYSDSDCEEEVDRSSWNTKHNPSYQARKNKSDSRFPAQAGKTDRNVKWHEPVT